jgi:exodeoxyribonuclease VII small subunit
MSAKSKSFEDSMEKLEQIVSEMESGELSLDAMIKRFEEGQGLIKFCSSKLNEVERKIEKLLNKDGEPETEPFGDDENQDETETQTKTEPAIDVAASSQEAELPF